MGVAAEKVTLPAADGHRLSATRFAADKPWATMVFGGAMGVRQDFYYPFARFLAGNGVSVLAFDYRGMGFSRQGSIRGLDVDVSAWAEKDLDAMLGEARRPDPALPLLFMGHSLGGQLLGVLPRNAEVRAALTVTAGSGWYKHNDRMPLQVRAFWFAMIPALTPLFGYFPGKALRMVGDLPRGVAWQWRRWCLHPEYLLAEGERYRSAFARVAAPIRAYSFEDDPMITRPAVDHLHTFYGNARVERHHVAPRDLDTKRIGHFGFFSKSSERTLWADSLSWLKTTTLTPTTPSPRPSPKGEGEQGGGGAP